MSNSLRDQLLKQGLVSKEQAKQAEKQAKLKEHQGQKTQSKKQKANKAIVDKESISYLAAKAREEEIARAKELNRQKEIERENKALWSQVRDIIDCQHVNDPDAEGTYYFLEDKWVRKIEVTLKQRQLLARGELAITSIEEKYYLVPAAVAEKVQTRVPEIVVCFHQAANGRIAEQNEAYIAYPIPDDLIW
jgi:uncharacterized protein